MVVALAAVALSVSACGSEKASSETSATEQWAGGVCIAVTDWKAAIEDAKATLADGGLSEANLNQAAGQAQEANQQLARSLQKLGKPDAADGEKAKQNLNDLETSLSFAMNQIKDTVEAKPASAAELATELTDVKQAVATMRTALSTAVTNLKQFDSSGDLETAFHDAPSCSGIF